MFRSLLSVAVSVACVAALPIEAGLPELETGIYLRNGSSTLDAGSDAVPTCSDWNNDGRKDLLIGVTGGYVSLYLNTGTDQQPTFYGYSRIESGGTPIATTSS